MPGWARTGQSFRVFPSQASGGAGVNPVCRFYIPPAHGNSHFFSASPAECNSIQQKSPTDPNYSGYVFESPAVFFVALPDTTTGACPAGTAPAYRLWNQRADSNHRYTAAPAIKAQMIAAGYVAEGYGPERRHHVRAVRRHGNARVRRGLRRARRRARQRRLEHAHRRLPGLRHGDRPASTSARAPAPARPSRSRRDRPVALQSALWATAFGNQTVSVPFANAFDTAVTIWVVAGPYATTQQTALTLWQTAQQIYTRRAAGRASVPVEIVDATANAKAATYAAFTCGTANASVTSIQADIGARPGRINVYLVGLVDGSTSRGNACAIGGGFVAIASGSGAELLAHELGHDFGLEHIDDLTTDFGRTNVMHSASNSRQYLTEGQTFRAHLRPELGDQPGLRPAPGAADAQLRPRHADARLPGRSRSACGPTAAGRPIDAGRRR